MSLVLKSGLLAWIEMQLLGIADIGGESVAWLRIIQNIISVVDQVKLDSVTNGEWRVVICRCVRLLLDRSRSGKSLFA